MGTLHNTLVKLSLITCFLQYVSCECVNKTSDYVYRRKGCGVSAIPTDILAAVKKVVLAINNIAHVDRGVFSHLTNCTWLDLPNNKLTEVKADMFRGLRSLTKLGLGHNYISYIEPGSFANLSLTNLYLDSNQLHTPLQRGDVFKSHYLLLLLGDNPLECDCRMCWIKQGEKEGWIDLTLTKSWNEFYDKPDCANYPSVHWDDIKNICPVIESASDNHDDQDAFTLVPANIDVSPVHYDNQNKLTHTAGDQDNYILHGVAGFGICLGLVLVVCITIILYKRLKRRSVESDSGQNIQRYTRLLRQHEPPQPSTSQPSISLVHQSQKNVHNATYPVQYITKLSSRGSDGSGYETPINHLNQHKEDRIYQEI